MSALALLGMLATPDATGDGARAAALLKSPDLHTLVYRETIDNIVRARDSAFDLRIETKSRPWFQSDDMNIAVVYLPAGPVLKGAQSFRAGGTLVFRGLPVKRGAELAVVTDGDLELSVSAEPVGTAKTPEQRTAEIVDTVAKSSGIGVAAAVLVIFLMVSSKRGGAAPAAGSAGGTK